MPYKKYDPSQVWVGVCFLGIAAAAGVLALPDAQKSQSHIFYVAIVGGLFVGVPAALGVGIIHAQLQLRKKERGHVSD